MKTIKNMMMAMSAVVMMMAASFNTATATENSWRMISADPAPNTVSEATPQSKIMQYYYVNDKNESRRFIYAVGADGRVTDRIMYGWDNEHQKWFPMTLTHANYGAESNTITHGIWNAETKRFGKMQSMNYNAADFSGSMIHLPAYANVQ